MITDRIREGIKQRASVNDEWDYGINQSWKNVLKIISENFEDTIYFIENDCTGDEFSWLSEIFNEIIDIFPSERIIEARRKTAKKYPEEVEKYNINSFISEADSHLDYILSTKNIEE